MQYGFRCPFIYLCNQYIFQIRCIAFPFTLSFIFPREYVQMPNISLHPRWLTAMPVYEHAMGAGTVAVSSLAFYLMITKTRTEARSFTKYLMLLQVEGEFRNPNYFRITGVHHPCGYQHRLPILPCVVASCSGRPLLRFDLYLARI